MDKTYRGTMHHYEMSLAKYGDTHLGVRWADAKAAELRYRVMLGVIQPAAHAHVSLLDFGCGASHLLDFLRQLGVDAIEYTGLDLLPAYIELSRQKYPDVPYYCTDILDPDINLPSFDYTIMNGVFFEQFDLSFSYMFEYFTNVVQQAFMISREGLALNLMSPHARHRQEGYFYLPLDQLASFLTAKLSPHFTLRHDYGLPEYTVYIYR